MVKDYIDLFTFDDGGGQNDGNTGDPNNEQTPGTTFTQEQVNEIVSNRLNKEKAKYTESLEKAKKWDEYQVTQQTETERLQNELNESNSLADKYKKQAEEQNNLITLTKENVKSDQLDFVMFMVQKNVSDDIDFPTALQTYKEKNPQYFGQTAPPKAPPGRVNNGGDPSKPGDMGDYFRKKYNIQK